MAAALLLPAPPALAQTFRLGQFDFFLTGKAEIGYESNIDGAYPEEEDPNYEKGDFFWLPGLALRSSSVAMRPSTTFNFAGAVEYLDYFKRSDEDAELYDLNLNFQTVLPRLTLGGLGRAAYEVESEQDTYRPGGSLRDPMAQQEGSVFANWNYRKFRIETHADYTSERHDKEEYKPDDEDETTLFAGVYLDLFTWGSIYYSWEKVVTTLVELDEETDEVTKNFGLAGSIPLSWLAHPKITYSVGFESEEVDTKGEEGEDPTWEPTHTITAQDELQLSKAISLAASATWENTEDEDEVTFEYNVQLSQQLGPRAQHSVTFAQEPQETFGSNADTETTTYTYNFGVKDLFFYGLGLTFVAEYELETPLGEEDEETEKTTSYDVTLNHTRQLSRRLSRDIAYSYSWENSNFHHEGALEEHLVTYGVTYDF